MNTAISPDELVVVFTNQTAILYVFAYLDNPGLEKLVVALVKLAVLDVMESQNSPVVVEWVVALKKV